MSQEMYVRSAARYATLDERSAGRLRRFQDRFLAKLAIDFRGDVLDVGCMDGRFANRFAESARSVVGLDVVAHRAWDALRRENLRFVAGDAQRLPFDDESFDMVVALAMLHHVPSPTRVLREMLRVRRPGGTLVIIEPNRLNPMTWLHLTVLSDHDHFTTKGFIRLVDRLLPIKEFRQFEAHLWPADGAHAARLERLDDAMTTSRWWRPFVLWNVAVA